MPGTVRPLCVRQLHHGRGHDAKKISEEVMIALRPLMVGPSGSLATIRDALEGFAHWELQRDTCSENANRRWRRLLRNA